MADDFDVEAMLEAPYRKEDDGRDVTEKERRRRRSRSSSQSRSPSPAKNRRRRSNSISRDHRRSPEHRNKREREQRRHRSKSREKERRHRSKSREKERRHRSKSRDRERRRSKSREKRRSKSRERRRSRSRDRRRSKSKERRGTRTQEWCRSKSRERLANKSKDRRRSRSRSRERIGHERYARKSRSISPLKGRGAREIARRSPSRSPTLSQFEFQRQPGPELTPEERDARTIFCMQLSARIRPRDLEEFFSSIGKVRDVRLITDNKTRRSKGIAYVEFSDVECVTKALALTGQRLLGVPIMVQPSQAEKNRAANATTTLQKGTCGPMRLYVGSLHFNITEEMLRGIFEPFGKIDDIKLIRDHETGRSQGYGFITFHDSDDAKKALEQLNGFELAGRPMKVGHVTDRTADSQVASILDSDEMDRAGIDLGATGRLQLMAKLAEGTGFQIPQYAASALNMNPPPSGSTAPSSPVATSSSSSPAAQAPPAPASQQPQSNNAPPIPTQCFMLSNMFDPTSESKSSWDQEIRDDVIEECNKHGGVVHIYVDKASPQGNVYVKCPSIAAAVASVNALHGRYFAGKLITAAYVPLPNYHALFAEAVRANQLLLPSTQALQYSYGNALYPGIQPSTIAR